MSASTLLDVRAVSAGYSGEDVIHDVSFDVAEGEAITIIGSNGAGKSTLFRAIITMLTVTSGSVHFDGRETTNVATYKLSRLGLAYVPAERHLFPQMSVHENLLLGAFPSKPDPMATMLAHLQSDPPPLAERIRGASREAVAAIVMRCMARRSEDRPPSVSALRRELAALSFPEGEAWTEDHASDWWDQHVPQRKSSSRPAAGPLAPKASLRAPGEGLAG